MLELLERGFKLNQIGGNTGVYVATNGVKSAVYVEDVFENLNRESEWFRSESAATAEAEAIVRERARELAFS